MTQSRLDVRRNLLRECGIAPWFLENNSAIKYVSAAAPTLAKHIPVIPKDKLLDKTKVDERAVHKQATTDEFISSTVPMLKATNEHPEKAEQVEQEILAAHDNANEAPEERRINLAHLSSTGSLVEEELRDSALNADLTSLKADIDACSHCISPERGATRVIGTGQDNKPSVMLVLNPPSTRELKEGRLLSGRAGAMLQQIIKVIGIDEESAYFCHATNCGVIQPLGSFEMAVKCRNHLQRQIGAIAPNVVLALGEIAAQSVLITNEPLERLRNETHTLDNGILVRASYHPFDLLDRPANKSRAWQDIKSVLPLIKGSNQAS